MVEPTRQVLRAEARRNVKSGLRGSYTGAAAPAPYRPKTPISTLDFERLEQAERKRARKAAKLHATMKAAGQ